MREILTVGYGSRDVAAVLALLRRNRVEVVCDVRSTPYSARYAAFNRETLKYSLGESGTKYLFLGDLLGARPSDPMLYVAGRASYAAMEESAPYREGIKRLEAGMTAYRIAMLCAEKDPLDCHRAILISRTLIRDGVSVQHIGPDGELEEHGKLERRMLQKNKLLQAPLFGPSSDSSAIAEAYERRAADLAFDADAAERARASP